jgi:hypothetical protein
MENILSQFNADNLDVKLTSEKLYINTTASSETFALRSVNGIGVVDLVDEYNHALTLYKNRKNSTKIFFYVCGIFFVVWGLICFLVSTTFAVILLTVSLVIFIVANTRIDKNNNEPILMSAVRIMMSGGNRDFKFDKTGVKSGNVAEFVTKVESTLTAYHKNND